MKDIAKIQKRLTQLRIFTLFVGVLWMVSIALLAASLTGFSGGSGITAMVVGESQAAQPAEKAGSASSFIYFAGFILFGGVLFVVSKYSTELTSVLKIEREKESFRTTPKLALGDFFNILINWSTKYASSTKSVCEVMQQINHANRSKLPVLKGVDFRFDMQNDRVNATISSEPEWEDLYVIFKAYLKELDISEERFIHIAEFLGKNDVALILRKVGEISDLLEKEIDGKNKKSPAAKKAKK